MPKFPVFSLSLGLILVLSGCGGAVGQTTAAAAPPPLFTGAAAQWIYQPPTGTGLNISGMVQGMQFALNTHDGGFDYPVQYADGSLGCTSFTDTLYYNLSDNICVPNPPGGFAPSTGAWGSNDGHLVVIDTATQTYYDFWKLLVNAQGQPTSTNVGQIVSGSLSSGNGTPGTTAAQLTGLAGDILPGELDCADCLQHALSVVVPSQMNSALVGTQAPAVKTDGLVSGAIFQEGAKLFIDPWLDVDALPVSTATKAIMKALQKYGGVVVDQTGGPAISFYSAIATQPDLTGINEIGWYLSIYY